MRTIPKHELAPWVFTLALGAFVSGALLAIAAVRLDWLVWLTLHPEAFGAGIAAVANVLGRGVKRLPHFKHPTTGRAVDTAREVLYREVIAATDTLTVIQGELDSAYERVVKLRDKLPPEG